MKPCMWFNCTLSLSRARLQMVLLIISVGICMKRNLWSGFQLVKRKGDTKQLIELPAVSFYGLLILKIVNTAMKNGEYEPDIFF